MLTCFAVIKVTNSGTLLIYIMVHPVSFYRKFLFADIILKNNNKLNKIDLIIMIIIKSMADISLFH